MIRRITFTILFFLSTFLFPWYITVLFALALVAVAPGYEIIIGGLVLDFVYGAVVQAFLQVLFHSLFSLGFCISAVIL